ncbi:MAG: double-strand break repair protein AddB [Hyphomicrobium sp. SCN 65-11]|nr:MAG: double-strand break repair protein AddB [Hyphomicrobium sp. SCN 65-11]
MSADTREAGTSAAARVWSISTGRSFLETLAHALLSGDLPQPGGAPPDRLALAGMTILLPTHRAVRALQEAFLRAANGRALLLPRLVPIAETDEDQGLITSMAGAQSPLAGEFVLGPAVAPLERQLALTHLVLAWSQQLRDAGQNPEGILAPLAAAGATTPAQAAHLAADLAQLMDMIETEEKSLHGLAALVPEEYSAHWQQTITFLEIVTKFWPAHLAERGLLSGAARRNQLIRAEAERLRRTPPAEPVIVAGVTGSVPATVALIRAVAQLPAGAIVIPGLDRTLDETSWRALDHHPEHPQHDLYRLLGALEVPREAVREVAGKPAPARAAVRTAFLSEVMRPAGATRLWKDYVARADRAELSAALDGISRIDAPNSADEAEVIALMMREALETPGHTAALVSPDRLLARRVAIRLQSWGITVDDSAGRPLAKTPHGAFLDLIAQAVATRFAPATVMALLKHPLTRLGLPVRDVRRAARFVELAALRTIYFGEGLDGIEASLERAERETLDGSRRERAVRRLWDADWVAARELLQRFRTAMAPLMTLAAENTARELHVLAAAHRATADALAAPGDETSPSRLWQDEDGEEADRLLAALDDQNLWAPSIPPADYAEFYRALAGNVTVRPRVAVHPRLSIWGPYEARLQQPDLVILGALNEGTWPAAADPGAWLNRPMRASLGLPSPEVAIGRAALDVTGLIGAREVVLTRANRVDGAPTVPSRWLMRIEALLGGMGLGDVLKPKRPWLGWARARDARIGKAEPVRAPEPRPALALRPRTLSASAIELWIKNPYGLYARHILALEALSPLGVAPGPREKGIIIHEALSRFTKRFSAKLPDDISGELMRDAEAVFKEYAAHPRVAAFWLPRIARFAEWFAATEPARRDGVTGIATEVAGSRVLEAPGGPFTLTARADRIDRSPNGLIITDYKTGTPPKDKDVTDGTAPQLPLEAAIARAKGFAGLDTDTILALRYIRATGGTPAGKEQTVKSDNVHALADFCIDQLGQLVRAYDNPQQPYRAVRRARFDYRYDDFAHLARVAEWSGGDNGDEGEAEE